MESIEEKKLLAAIEELKADRDAWECRALSAEVDRDFFQGEVKLRNRIPPTCDAMADMLRRAEKAEADAELAWSQSQHWIDRYMGKAKELYATERELSELSQATKDHAERVAKAVLEATVKAVQDVDDVVCETCGNPKNNHNYRHPFVAKTPVDVLSAIKALDLNKIIEETK